MAYNLRSVVAAFPVVVLGVGIMFQGACDQPVNEPSARPPGDDRAAFPLSGQIMKALRANAPSLLDGLVLTPAELEQIGKTQGRFPDTDYKREAKRLREDVRRSFEQVQRVAKAKGICWEHAMLTALKLRSALAEPDEELGAHRQRQRGRPCFYIESGKERITVLAPYGDIGDQYRISSVWLVEVFPSPEESSRKLANWTYPGQDKDVDLKMAKLAIDNHVTGDYLMALGHWGAYIVRKDDNRVWQFIPDGMQKMGVEAKHSVIIHFEEAGGFISKIEVDGVEVVGSLPPKLTE